MSWWSDWLNWFLSKKEPKVQSLENDELIKKWEGLRLRSYRDSVGVWTVGWGHTSTAKRGMHITLDKAEELFKEDIAWAEEAVRTHVKVDLKQHEFDALVSFTFNVGEGAFAKSTLLNKLNKADFDGAASEFLRWVHAGGKKLRGLERRRQDERRYFLWGKKVKT